jgi:hypothetical protein
VTEPSTKDTEATSFAVFLAQHAKGRTRDELSEKLRDLILAVQDIGKAGTLTLKIDREARQRRPGRARRRRSPRSCPTSPRRRSGSPPTTANSPATTPPRWPSTPRRTSNR